MYSTKHYFKWWIYSGMLIGALGVHPTFYPAVQTLKSALYLLNKYVYYNSLTYLYKIVTKTLIGASLTACCYTEPGLPVLFTQHPMKTTLLNSLPVTFNRTSHTVSPTSDLPGTWQRDGIYLSTQVQTLHLNVFRSQPKTIGKRETMTLHPGIPRAYPN